tara:strand:+ start:993 stop:2063 length:1071 start_codon:yes stop_codon:yes gene_type:complete
MSAYKQFNTQDLIVSPFEVNKGFYFIGGDELIKSDVGVNRFIGLNGNYLQSGSILTGTGLPSSEQLSSVLVYDSIKQLYYTNYLSGSAGFTSDAITASVFLGANEIGNTLIGNVQQTNFYNYEQTTLWPNKTLPTASLGVISIPSKLFGDYVQPNSFYIEHPKSGSIKDDGEGRLLWKGVSSPTYEYIDGNIIYPHGIVILSDDTVSSFASTDVYGNNFDYGTSKYGGTIVLSFERFIDAFITSNEVTMSFSSSYKIFETQYQCTINENEFNYTLNPSAITGSQIPTKFSGSVINWENTASIGKPFDFVTGSYFEPYITTVGLYNGDFELLAIGKLAQPLQSSPTTDTTILVNIDR